MDQEIGKRMRKLQDLAVVVLLIYELLIDWWIVYLPMEFHCNRHKQPVTREMGNDLLAG